jgi:hypothetical protein
MFTPTREPGPHPPRGALARYLAAWLAAAALLVAGSVALLGRSETDDTAAIVPLRQTELTRAADIAHCALRRPLGNERLAPPVDAPPGTHAAAAGIYDEPLAAAPLGGAARRGIVVIHYGPGITDDALEMLNTLQRGAPNGTIVTPSGAGTRYALAATAFRRLLGCPQVDERALEAVRLFHGRYMGRGPAAG